MEPLEEGDLLVGKDDLMDSIEANIAARDDTSYRGVHDLVVLEGWKEEMASLDIGDIQFEQEQDSVEVAPQIQRPPPSQDDDDDDDEDE